MLEGETGRDSKEIDASGAGKRAQRQRLRWLGSAGASYLLDAFFLGLFVLAGTVPVDILLLYVAMAGAVCAVPIALYATDRNLKFADPNFILPQAVAAVGLQLLVVGLAPQVAFPFVSNLFTVFAFGVIWMRLRDSMILWAASTMAVGVTLWLVRDRAGFAAASVAEAAVTWLFFSAILGRCLLLSIYANDMRTRLAEGRRKLAASLERAEELVHYDELTRVFNRRTLTERLEQERSRAERTKAPLSVAMMDLDHFKVVNDTHGHGVGDEVLRMFAATIQSAMRDTDVFGRYGGEEFLLILTATAPGEAGPALERLRAGIESADWGSVKPGLSVTVSMGVAGLRKDESPGQLLHRADTALYDAKRAGRNRIVISE